MYWGEKGGEGKRAEHNSSPFLGDISMCQRFMRSGTKTEGGLHKKRERGGSFLARAPVDNK